MNPETLGKQFHGTRAVLQPGDKVLPRSVTGAPLNAATGRDTSAHVGTTAHLPLAAQYGAHVYVVRPVGARPDPEYADPYGDAHPQRRQTFDAEADVDWSSRSLSAHIPMTGDGSMAPPERSVASGVVQDVPVSSLRATQTWHDEEHARALSAIPREAWEATEARHLPTVNRLMDGTHVLLDGHHRARAAQLRGEDSLRVRVKRVPDERFRT